MTTESNAERQPLLRSHSSLSGVAASRGSSSLGQTILNSTNVLLGVGLLSLPLGIKLAGWVAGLLMLSCSALVTIYTARVLARCLDLDKSSTTYADLAYASYGARACDATRMLFSITLLTACVALAILFGDIMNLLIPSLSVIEWKIVCGIVLLPLHFLPFSVLSFASIIGVAASFGLVVMTILAGILKDHFPGTLRHPAATSLFPASWTTLPMSFGLIMSPWGGHASFPNLYRDMQNPKKYDIALLTSFALTFSIDLTMAVCGYLMYGADTRDEIIANILVTPGHPHALLTTIVVLVAVMPVTKIPLCSRPLVIMVEAAAGLTPSESDVSDHTSIATHVKRIGIRIFTVLLMIILSIICPNFDVVMAFAGSALCLTICVVLPLLFYLKLFEGRISPKERILDWTLIGIATMMAVIGTLGAVIPREILTGQSHPEAV